MEPSEDRVLAYDLATDVAPPELDEITGGRSIHMPTMKPTGDVLSLDMTLDY